MSDPGSHALAPSRTPGEKAEEPAGVTLLLARHRAGDKEAFDAAFTLVYAELKRVAGRMLRGERSRHTLSATALVHEAYVRLVAYDAPDLASRIAFLGLGATVLKHVLQDYGRRQKRQKRGGDFARRVDIEEALTVVDAAGEGGFRAWEWALAMESLERLDPVAVRIAELHLFAGLGHEEIAEHLETSKSTVKRKWTVAKRHLTLEMLGAEAAAARDAAAERPA